MALHRAFDVVVDQVGVDGDRGCRTRASRGDHLGAWVDDIPGRPDTGGAGPTGGIDGHESGLIECAAEAGRQAVGVREVARSDEDRGSRDHATVGQLDAGQPVRLDHQPGDLALDDANTARLQLRLFRRGQVVGVGEEDDVLAPLTDQLRMLDRAGMRTEHSDGLIADLPSVAVRAVQQIPAPPRAHAWDIGELIAHTGGEQDSPGRHDRAATQMERESGIDLEHPIIEHFDAVAGDLGSAGGEEVGRRHPISREKPLHVGGGCIAGRARVDNGDPPPRSSQHECCAQSGRASTDHHHVVRGDLSRDPGEQLGVVGELQRVFECQSGCAPGCPGKGQRRDLNDLAFPPGGGAGISLRAGDVQLGGHRVTAGRGRHGQDGPVDRVHRVDRVQECGTRSVMSTL